MHTKNDQHIFLIFLSLKSKVYDQYYRKSIFMHTRMYCTVMFKQNIFVQHGKTETFLCIALHEINNSTLCVCFMQSCNCDLVNKSFLVPMAISNFIHIICCKF